MNTKPVSERWLQEALTRAALEVKQFSRTFIAFALHPARSARAWQSGEQPFMNPLAFAAAAAAVYWAVSAILAAFWPIPTPESGETLSGEFMSAAGPYVQYGLLGATMHLGLRWLGSRSHMASSVGAAFFAGGSIGTIGAIVVTAAARWLSHARGTSALTLESGDVAPFFLFGAAVLFYIAICINMARALLTLHRTAAWKVIVAGLFAVVVTALLFGSVLPDGDYGWHPYLGVDLGGETTFSFGFRG